jgi:hypothetical protein
LATFSAACASVRPRLEGRRHLGQRVDQLLLEAPDAPLAQVADAVEGGQAADAGHDDADQDVGRGIAEQAEGDRAGDVEDEELPRVDEVEHLPEVLRGARQEAALVLLDTARDHRHDDQREQEDCREDEEDDETEHGLCASRRPTAPASFPGCRG